MDNREKETSKQILISRTKMIPPCKLTKNNQPRKTLKSMIQNKKKPIAKPAARAAIIAILSIAFNPDSIQAGPADSTVRCEPSPDLIVPCNVRREQDQLLTGGFQAAPVFTINKDGTLTRYSTEDIYKIDEQDNRISITPVTKDQGSAFFIYGTTLDSLGFSNLREVITTGLLALLTAAAVATPVGFAAARLSRFIAGR